jgi:hypothetical protein
VPLGRLTERAARCGDAVFTTFACRVGVRRCDRTSRTKTTMNPQVERFALWAIWRARPAAPDTRKLGAGCAVDEMQEPRCDSDPDSRLASYSTDKLKGAEVTRTSTHSAKIFATSSPRVNTATFSNTCLR